MSAFNEVESSDNEVEAFDSSDGVSSSSEDCILVHKRDAPVQNDDCILIDAPGDVQEGDVPVTNLGYLAIGLSSSEVKRIELYRSGGGIAACLTYLLGSFEQPDKKMWAVWKRRVPTYSKLCGFVETITESMSHIDLTHMRCSLQAALLLICSSCGNKNTKPSFRLNAQRVFNEFYLATVGDVPCSSLFEAPGCTAAPLPMLGYFDFTSVARLAVLIPLLNEDSPFEVRTDKCTLADLMLLLARHLLVCPNTSAVAGMLFDATFTYLYDWMMRAFGDHAEYRLPLTAMPPASARTRFPYGDFDDPSFTLEDPHVLRAAFGDRGAKMHMDAHGDHKMTPKANVAYLLAAKARFMQHYDIHKVSFTASLACGDLFKRKRT